MSWTPTADGRKYCARHAHTFTPGLETCPGCDLDPSHFIPIASEPDELHEDDRNLELLANEALQRSKVASRVALEKIGDTNKDFRDALLAMAQADKSARLYAELVGPRKAERHDRWLADQNRKLKSGRGN